MTDQDNVWSGIWWWFWYGGFMGNESNCSQLKLG